MFRASTFTGVVAAVGTGPGHPALGEPEAVRRRCDRRDREVLGLRGDEPIPVEDIAAVKMGTTVATNALWNARASRPS